MMPAALEEAKRALASSEVLLKRDGFVQPGVSELLVRLGAPTESARHS